VLGCVLFQTLTGIVPYDRGSDVETMWAHIHEPPPELLDVCPDLPAALGDVIAVSLAKAPDDRQSSAGELARAARAALEGTEHVSSRSSRPACGRRPAAGGRPRSADRKSTATAHQDDGRWYAGPTRSALSG
jgi:serine/threonine-protein kinase